MAKGHVPVRRGVMGRRFREAHKLWVELGLALRLGTQAPDRRDSRDSRAHGQVVSQTGGVGERGGGWVETDGT